MLLSAIRTNKRFGCIITVFCFAIIGLTSYCLLSHHNAKKLRQAPHSVAKSFAVRLQTNKLEEALSLVTSEKHSKLESWMQDHVRITCPLSLESFEDDVYYVQLIHDGETRKRFNYGSESACPDHTNWYSFIVNDIVVEKREDDWVVIDWGEIEESPP